MQPQNGILDQIKSWTETSHRAVEAQLGFLLLPTVSLDSLQRLLNGFFDFIAPQEERLLAALREKQDRWLHAISYGERLRTELLTQDLMGLGYLAGVRQEVSLPSLSTPAERLGYLYVLEGSSLGGRIINRHLAASLGLEEASAIRYFSLYGADLGGRWKAFTQVLENFIATHPSQADAVCHAAEDTFSKLSRVLANRLDPQNDVIPTVRPQSEAIL